MTTPILKLPEAANGQIDQYLTYNEALRALEASANNFYSVDMSTGDVTLTDTSSATPSLNYIFSRNILFRAFGNSVARVLTIPAVKRLFVVSNAGTSALTVKRGSAEVSIPASQSRLFYSDGTTNGLAAISGGGSGGGIETIVAGDGISVNSADPANPIVSATSTGGGIESIEAGPGISIDSTDPENPIISSPNEWDDLIEPTISSGTLNIDLSSPSGFVVTLNSNITTMNFINAPSNKFVVFAITFIQDGTGGRTVSWPASVQGSPSQPGAAANAITIMSFATFDGGSTVYQASS